MPTESTDTRCMKQSPPKLGGLCLNLLSKQLLSHRSLTPTTSLSIPPPAAIDHRHLSALPNELRERLLASIVSTAPVRLACEPLSCLVTRFTTLLDLSGFAHLDASNIVHLIATCATSVVTLCLDRLAAVNTTTFERLFERVHGGNAGVFASLRKLSISGCIAADAPLLELLLQQAPKLISIDAARCPRLQLTERLIGALASHGCVARLNLSRSDPHQLSQQGMVFDPFADEPQPPALATPPTPHNDHNNQSSHLPTSNSTPCDDATQSTASNASSMCRNAPALRYLSLNYCRTWVTDRLVASICRTFARLVELHLKDCHQITDAALEALNSSCRSVSVVRLDFCHALSSAAINQLALSMASGLRSIGLSGCYQIDDHAIEAIAMSCPNLMAITLVDCDRLSSSSIESLVARCASLVHVSVSRLSNVSAAFDAIALRCKHLKSLKWCSNDHAIDSNSCSRLAGSSGSTLECFAANNTQLTDTCVANLLKHGCTRLKRVDVSHCVALTDVSITNLARYCSGALTCLNLSSNRLSDQCLVTLANHCPNLTALDISCCSNIRAQGIKAIAKQCRSLADLNLSGCMPKRGALETVCSSCPRLQSIKVSSSLLSDSMLRSLYATSPLLRVLHIDGALHLSDKAFEQCLDAHHRPASLALQHVKLIDCPRITDQAISMLANGCVRSLSELFLIRCSAITDQSMRLLESLNQAPSTNANDVQRGVLLSLYLCQNTAISKHAVRRLRTQCPHIKVMGSLA
jgi:hypothetical protein